MNENHRTTIRDAYLENLGAELTEAAYPVLLRLGVVDNWLDLELDLWKVMREAVRKLIGSPAKRSTSRVGCGNTGARRASSLRLE